MPENMPDPVLEEGGYKYDLKRAKVLGAEIKAAFRKKKVSGANFATLLALEGFVTSDSMINRVLAGKVKGNAHMIQAIARSSIVQANYKLPDDYDGCYTDYFLDRISGRVEPPTQINTRKTADIADAKRAKTSVNDDVRHGNSSPRKRSSAAATIPEETISKSGASTVGIKEGAKLLKEAIGKESLSDLSARCGVSRSDLKAIVDGTKEASSQDLARIGKVVKNLDVQAVLEAYYL